MRTGTWTGLLLDLARERFVSMRRSFGSRFSIDTSPRKPARASRLRRVAPIRETSLAPKRAEGQDRRLERRQAPRALAWPHTVPSISRCREFHTVDRGKHRSPRLPQSKCAHRKPRGRELEWFRLAPWAGQCW